MRQCLLCQSNDVCPTCTLSGRELRSLWDAIGTPLADDAFGAITPDYRVSRLKCRGCGFQFFDPRLAGSEIFYRQLRNEDYFAAERPEFFRTLEFAKRRQLTKVLDVGCGSGVFLDLARAQGLITHGLDLNRLAAAEARLRSHVVFDKLLSNLDPGVFLERYDLITLFQVLEHVADPVPTMRKAARLLSPGGYISIAVPNSHGLPSLSWLQPQQWPPHHVSHWRKRDFQTLAEAAKLRLVMIQSDVLFGRDIEKIWLLQRRLAAAIERPPAAPPSFIIKSLSFVYRKTGVKFLFPRLGSSIQAYFSA